MATGTPVSLVAGEAHLGATGGQKAAATVAFTRPADATAYTAKDAVNVILLATAATNATPIVVTTPTHSLADGDPITISGMVGNTAANGNFYAQVTGQSATTFALYSDKALTTPVAGNGAWTSGGSVARVLRFLNMARLVGGGGYLIKGTVLTSQTTNTETYRLHLYNTPPAALLDNAPCTAPLYADAAGYLGSINFPAAVTEGASSTAAYANAVQSQVASNLPLAFLCAAADRDLYGILEAVIGFTPATGQTFTIRLWADVD